MHSYDSDVACTEVYRPSGSQKKLTDCQVDDLRPRDIESVLDHVEVDARDGLVRADHRPLLGATCRVEAAQRADEPLRHLIWNCLVRRLGCKIGCIPLVPLVDDAGHVRLAARAAEGQVSSRAKSAGRSPPQVFIRQIGWHLATAEENCAACRGCERYHTVVSRGADHLCCYRK